MQRFPRADTLFHFPLQGVSQPGRANQRAGVLKACEKVCFLNLPLLRVQEECGQK